MTLRQKIKMFEQKSNSDFEVLNNIITLNRKQYKNGLMTLNKYYKFFNNIENFKKEVMNYYESEV